MSRPVINAPLGTFGAAVHNRSTAVNNNVTIGPWTSEDASGAALDTVLEQADLWRVYAEVPGTLVQPRPTQIDKTVRIDRVLVPNANLMQLGWTHGVIGIEVKKSDVKIGPPIAQAMDYSRSVWKLPGGFSTWLDWVFIWPMGKTAEAVESICCQHRIGSAYSTDWDLLYLQSGHVNVINIRRSGEIIIGAAINGRKAGSR